MKLKNNDFLFTSRKWHDLISKLYKKNIQYFSRDNLEIPFIEHKDFISRRTISLPNTDFSYFSLKKNINLNLSKYNFEQNTVKVLSKNKINYECKFSNYYYLEINNYENFLKNLNSNFKRNLKKDVYVKNELNLKKFYNLYFKTKLKYFNQMPYPYKYFVLLKKIFQKNLILLFSYHKNKLLGSSLFLDFNNSLYYIAGACEKSNLPCHHKIFSEIVKIAIDRKIKYLFLGTDASSFKKSMGASKLILNNINFYYSKKKLILLRRKIIQIIIQIYIKTLLKFGFGKKYYYKLYNYCK